MLSEPPRVGTDGLEDEICRGSCGPLDDGSEWHAVAMAPRSRPPQPSDADGFRAAWAETEQRWAETVERASGLPAELLHERVRGEWSFVQTLRHLLFVTDAWGSRALLGAEAAYHPLGLPPTGMRNAGVDVDEAARPALPELLPLRAERQAVVRELMAGLTDPALEESVRVRGPGYPRAGLFPVRRCVQVLVSEEWAHRDYAERDLAVLERSRA